jgi:tRNA pseudouridine55 synthase
MEHIDGLINLYKPVGITSAKAVYKVRSIVHQRKIGHAGTLDPAAEGVLVLLLGKGTKLVERFMDQPKVYRTTARLDITSSSFDSEGDVQPVTVAQPPTLEQVAAALATFEGEQLQVPPAVSALKVGGVPSYKLARAGVDVQHAGRTVHIYWTHLYAYAWPTVDFEMACGRGTYVRSVIRDLGQRLGTGGCLTGLLRRAVGPLTAENAWTLPKLATAKPSDCILPLGEAEALLARAPAQIPARPV